MTDPAPDADRHPLPDPAHAADRRPLPVPAPIDADSVASREEAAEEDAREDALDPFGEGPDDM
ncbi:hypothetical protein CMsap09_11720 [Clavibacter michiganensis]|uniref:Uncharacterized protein n=1 Tax=Clavibacter michiganensis TaxID=28447 RepID=A0A251XVU8_9MICO|nr:hypothetical protein CMsap09_11720 [Clavibacter michiganensis]